MKFLPLFLLRSVTKSTQINLTHDCAQEYFTETHNSDRLQIIHTHTFLCFFSVFSINCIPDLFSSHFSLESEYPKSVCIIISIDITHKFQQNISVDAHSISIDITHKFQQNISVDAHSKSVKSDRRSVLYLWSV